MRILGMIFGLLIGLTGPAPAGDYTLENRPEVVFKGGTVRVSPYPQGKRASAVWASDECWRKCQSNCAWQMDYCVRSTPADVCRPQMDNCARACQRECRGFFSGPFGGPLVGLIDWY